ncbi:ATP-binding response regulator [Actomonas aquatica]|uniref:histidine kinase n=1 Tax=Actomonas aquatica TaxID=2866162 RepID=A0ABZ1CHR6_9BACT|nr:response regulator [Opitutus sp. WL0086]WRQ90129.1 response regulator [Opitutus sp. WL0086]
MSGSGSVSDSTEEGHQIREPGSTPVCESVWELSAAGLCLVDEDGTVLRVNRAFADSLGYEVAAMAGMPIGRIHPPDTALAMKAMHEALVRNEPATAWLGREMRFKHQRGRPVMGYVRNARLVTPTGRVQRLITFVDMIDMVRSDPRMRQQLRVENFSALASAISNDLNNLLSIIMGYTALLQEGQADARRLRVVSEGVESAVQRASTLVRQTLYLARRPEAVLRPVPLNPFVERRLEQARSSIGDRVVNLRLSGDRSLLTVPLDEAQIGDAFDELIQRVHAVDPDGLRPLQIETRAETGEELRRRFGHATDAAYAVVELSHPGRPRTSSRGPFLAADLTDVRAGHDLGITMVERIIDSHRGFMAQQVLSGGGLAYTLVFPLVERDSGLAEVLDAEASSPAAGSPNMVEPAPVVPAGDQRRILVVDDESGLLTTIVETLRREGYFAIGAADGLEALKLFRQYQGQFDLVICDLVLPKMNGWEVFTGMREIRADVAVVIMSGHLEPKLKDAVQRSGASAFLQKPFSMGAFLRFVRKLVEPVV